MSAPARVLNSSSDLAKIGSPVVKINPGWFEENVKKGGRTSVTGLSQSPSPLADPAKMLFSVKSMAVIIPSGQPMERSVHVVPKSGERKTFPLKEPRNK